MQAMSVLLFPLLGEVHKKWDRIEGSREMVGTMDGHFATKSQGTFHYTMAS
jgi:hypothetical protein